MHEARIRIPPLVEVSKVGDELVFSGPLGTSRTGLSRIDGLGHAALRLVPEEREIAVCTPSKAFFGTLQVWQCALSSAAHDMWLSAAPSCAASTACTGILWNLQSTIQNKLEGVTKGFLIYLRIAGIGYRAAQEGQTLTFKLGYSHDIAYELPASVRGFLPEPTLVGLYGIDKNQVLLSRPFTLCVMQLGKQKILISAHALASR